jgi:hypothetical protein
MDTPRRPRVFVDANILIRGITFPRYPYEILRLAASHVIVPVVSPSVLAVTSVCSFPHTSPSWMDSWRRR